MRAPARTRPRRRRSLRCTRCWTSERRPSSTAATPAPVVVGVKFTADTDGSIAGLRFYKAAANTGTHVGTLYSSTGTARRAGDVHGRERNRLADREVRLAGRDHGGHDLRRQLPGAERSLLGDRRGVQLRAARQRRRCTRLPTATSQNGVYAYSGTAAFPVSSYNATNYWVDVLFAPSRGVAVRLRPSSSRLPPRRVSPPAVARHRSTLPGPPRIRPRAGSRRPPGRRVRGAPTRPPWFRASRRGPRRPRWT